MHELMPQLRHVSCSTCSLQKGHRAKRGPEVHLKLPRRGTYYYATRESWRFVGKTIEIWLIER